MSSNQQDKTQYWDGFYEAGAGDRIPPPSQFAAFVAQELESDAHVIDVGCGSGRDSLFFAQRGLPVLGIDASKAAIENCQSTAERLGLSQARFRCASVETEEFPQLLADSVSAADAQAVVYARFFLHALTDEEQERLLSALSEALRPGDLFVAEYRTTRDAMLSKETSAHYRRYIDPAQLLVDVAARGYAVNYAAEGFGYAKYRHDDAHVARAIFERQ